MSVRAVLACLASLLAFPVQAQSSLGVSGISMELASIEDEAGARRANLTVSIDARITDFHGVQGDLVFADMASGTMGHLGAHLYMAPEIGQKYGLFLSLSDMDGRSMAWVSAGAEGMVELGDATLLEGRLGLGAADGNSLDYVFGGVSLAHEVTSAVEVEAALGISDFDEVGLRATSWEASLVARYRPEGAPWELYASATRSDLTGRNGAPGANRIGFGLTVNFGNAGGINTDTRHFRRAGPLDPLIRRALW